MLVGRELPNASVTPMPPLQRSLEKARGRRYVVELEGPLHISLDRAVDSQPINLDGHQVRLGGIFNCFLRLGLRTRFSGLHSDSRKMVFKWAANCSLVSLRSSLGIAKIRFSPNDLGMLKVPLPDAADKDACALRL